MTNRRKSRYMAKYGARVHDNGYDIIPIRPFTKRPALEEWGQVSVTPQKLRRWVEGAYGGYGVGIVTRRTPLVDIDCYDGQIVAMMVKFVERKLGKTIKRIGLAPKVGLVYQADRPFSKVTSQRYYDPDAGLGPGGNPVLHKLEILGDGQQFVALGIHPDTKNPYRWNDKQGPQNTSRAELPLITRAEAGEIVAEFERLMLLYGFVPVPASSLSGTAQASRIEVNGEFAAIVPKVNISTDELSLRLQLVPGAEDYETWIRIGMALFHQYDGGAEGLELWHEWSSQANNYDHDALEDKWRYLDHRK